MAQDQPYRDMIWTVFDPRETPPPPLFTIQEILKQVRCADLPARTRRAMGVALPGFTERFIFAKELNQLRAYLYQGITPAPWPGGATKLNHNAARRFSGGDDLGRGAYYTIARDATGEDGGGLLDEMRAYRDTAWTGAVQVFDDKQVRQMEGPERAFYDDAADWRGSIGILFIDSPNAPSRYFTMQETLPEADFVRALSPTDRLCGVRVPYGLWQIERARVFDLRQQSAQQWLVEFLARINVCDCDMRPMLVEDFVDALSVITCPRPGGSVWTEMVGAVLRAHGASGMIFPSARASSLMTYVDDWPQTQPGWVFVDYFDAVPVPLDEPIEILSESSLRSLEELKQSFVTLKGAAPGWGLTGLSRQWDAWEDQRYRDVLNETATQRSDRMMDYLDFARIVGFFEDKAFRARMDEAMTACGLEGGVDSISMRNWQYVLEFVNVKDHIPRLGEITPRSLPMGIELIGYDGPEKFIKR